MTNTDMAGESPTVVSSGRQCGAGGEADIATPVGLWAVRPATQRRGRAALEVYERGELLDVVVESTLGSGLLRGARRDARRGRWASFAWGRLPRDGALPVVAFIGRLGRHRQSARVVPVAGAFWFACAEGSFHGVLVQTADGPSIRLRAGRAA